MAIEDIKKSMNLLSDAIKNLGRGNNLLNLLKFDIKESDLYNSTIEQLPPRKIVEAEEEWEAYLKNTANGISTRLMRRLCWVPSIALDQRFHELCKVHFSEHMSNSAQLGLLYSIANRWSEWFPIGAVNDDFLKYFRQMLKVRGSISFQRYLLREDGPILFVQEKLQGHPNLEGLLKKTFCIALNGTQFLSAIRKQIAHTHGYLIFDNEEVQRHWIRDEILLHLEKSDVLEVLSKVVITYKSVPPPHILSDFRDFLIKYQGLGDPRAEGSLYKWRDVDEVLRKRISEWFSQEDIRVFFDTFFVDMLDSQGRKEFWLPYAGSVQRTRVLVGQADQVKAHRMSRTLRESSTIGKLKDTEGSAFVMDFGSVIVVEYSLAGNAAYFYLSDSDAKVVKDFWSRIFQNNGLKDKSSGKQMIHNSGWQNRFANELAERGVRPKRC